MQALGPIKARINVIRLNEDKREDPHLHPARASPKANTRHHARPASPPKHSAAMVASRVDVEVHEVGRAVRGLLLRMDHPSSRWPEQGAGRAPLRCMDSILLHLLRVARA